MTQRMSLAVPMAVTSMDTSVNSTGPIPVSSPLRRLMYMSMATDPSDCNPEYLRCICQQSATSNERIRVSGFLMYSAPFFFQVIEGEPDVIETLYVKITKDVRHRNCHILSDLPCEERLYEDWHMKEAHMNTIVMHPVICTVLRQISTSFAGMWAYMPRNAADFLLRGRNPNKQCPRHMEVAVAFVHIAHYAAILQRPDLLMHLPATLRAFVDLCVRNVTKSGGYVAKFTDGMCMAYWPRQRAADALQVLCELKQDCGELRANHPTDLLSLLRVYCGLHCGLALLCNAGTKKADFTLLGDIVNTGARVTALAKKLDTGILFTTEVYDMLSDASRGDTCSAGLQQLKGVAQPVECWFMPRFRLNFPELLSQIHAFQPLDSPNNVKRYEELNDADAPPVFKDRWLESLRGHPAEPWQNVTLVSPRVLQVGAPFSSPATQVVGNTELLTLTYISHSVAAWSDVELRALQRECSSVNSRHNITSSLLYIEGLIVQTLEGPSEQVLTTFDRIKRDRRHYDVVIVHLIPLRVLNCWSPMEVIIVGAAELAVFPPLHDVVAQVARCYVSLKYYVPSMVSRHLVMGQDLKNLQPVLVDIVMLATDICNFTSLSEVLSLTEIWKVSTTFIDCCSDCISSHGGDVLKLIGDCVTAYFPTDGAGEALMAAKEIVCFCAKLRKYFAGRPDCRSLITCGVGLDCGTVLLAQSGSLGVTEFSVTGEVSTRVMEVEALTRSVDQAIAVSRAFLDLAPQVAREFQETGLEVQGMACYALIGNKWQLGKELNMATIRNFSSLAAPGLPRRSSSAGSFRNVFQNFRRSSTAFDLQRRTGRKLRGHNSANCMNGDSPVVGVLARWGFNAEEDLSVGSLSSLHRLSETSSWTQTLRRLACCCR